MKRKVIAFSLLLSSFAILANAADKAVHSMYSYYVDMTTYGTAGDNIYPVGAIVTLE